jgi:hypothetical protein
VRIVAFAGQDVCDELASALESATSVMRVWDEGAFHVALRAGSASLFAVDPDHMRADVFERLIERAYDSPSAVVIYTALTRTTASRILGAARRHRVEVIIRGDEPRKLLRAKLELAQSGTISSHVLQHLSTRSGLRVGAVMETVVGLFCGAPLPTSVAAIAMTVELGPRSLARAITNAGITGPIQLLNSARALRYYRDACELAPLQSGAPPAQRPEISPRLVRDILKSIGAPSPRQLFKIDAAQLLNLVDAYLLL